MKKYHLAAFGEALIDFTPTADGAYRPNPGGAPFNLAACTAKCGCSTAFVGKVGNDAFGRLLKDTAEEYGVLSEGMVFDDERVTTHAFLTLSDGGERDFVFCREHGADLAITVNDINESIIESSLCFHFGGLSLSAQPLKDACLHALRLAKGSGCIISFDPNYRAPLWKSEGDFRTEVKEVLQYVDVLKVSEEEALLITGEAETAKAAKALSHIPIVLITRGKQGAVCCAFGREEAVHGYPANTVDTTGAGDIFFGTFLSCLLLEKGGLDAMDFDAVLEYCDKACCFAAKSTEKYGAIPSIPNFYF